MRCAAIWFLPMVDTDTFSNFGVPSEASTSLDVTAPFTTGHDRTKGD